MTILVHEALSPEAIAAARTLMIEYRDSISTPLCFQNFDAEMAALPGRYARPSGRLYLAVDSALDSAEQAIGCIALREIDPGPLRRVCEMKRLYVRQSHQGRGVGRLLCSTLIDAARESGFAAMRLDTDTEMAAAQALYRSLGFRPIPKYNNDPIPDTLFFELIL